MQILKNAKLSIDSLSVVAGELTGGIIFAHFICYAKKRNCI